MAEKSIPKVSVLVPTYNQGQWLAECLESIVTQKTSFSFEVIVGDDASTDPLSRAILEEYASRFPNVVIPIWHEKNIGPWQNNLFVMRGSRGEFISHCDGDDKMLPGKLQKQADFLDDHPSFSMVVHDALTLNPNGIRKINILPYKGDSLDVEGLLKDGMFFCNSSTMSRKSHQTVWVSDKPVLDYLLFIDRAMAGPIGIIHEPVGCWHH
jgi:glycosyltransferase involved in cell wall biosynthesis